VRFLGRLPRRELLEAIRGSRFLVVPSIWYEGFPMVIAEAFACGVPPIVSRLGGMREVVQDGNTGLHFTPGDTEDLARKIAWAWSEPGALEEMGRAARGEYEARYTAERNYELLVDIYQQAMVTAASEPQA
jgi:glycosyltransferase involved in cell wall biosynthesis